MSTTYHIGCLTCKEHIWIGQTSHSDEIGLDIYTGEETTMDLLCKFLSLHMSDNGSIYLGEPQHQLVFGSSEPFWEDGWKEIDSQNPNYVYVS